MRPNRTRIGKPQLEGRLRPILGAVSLLADLIHLVSLCMRDKCMYVSTGVCGGQEIALGVFPQLLSV